MRVVYKYELQPGVDREIEVSRDAVVVYVAEQVRNRVTLWIETSPDWVQERRTYTVIGTGHPIPHKATHVGSALCLPFVWHVYELNGRER